MPKLSDYELEHMDDEQKTVQRFKKKNKKIKSNKHTDKVNHRSNWVEPKYDVPEQYDED